MAVKGNTLGEELSGRSLSKFYSANLLLGNYRKSYFSNLVTYKYYIIAIANVGMRKASRSRGAAASRLYSIMLEQKP